MRRTIVLLESNAGHDPYDDEPTQKSTVYDGTDPLREMLMDPSLQHELKQILGHLGWLHKDNMSPEQLKGQERYVLLNIGKDYKGDLQHYDMKGIDLSTDRPEIYASFFDWDNREFKLFQEVDVEELKEAAPEVYKVYRKEKKAHDQAVAKKKATAKKRAETKKKKELEKARALLEEVGEVPKRKRVAKKAKGCRIRQIKKKTRRKTRA